MGGGAAAIASGLHEYINNNTKHNSTFIYGRGEVGYANSKKINNNIDIYLSAFSTRFLGESINFNFDKCIENYLINCDLIHLHNMHGYYIDNIKLIKLIVKVGKPVVWTFHDQWPITGRCASPYKCNKWIEGCHNCGNKDFYPKTYIDFCQKSWLLKKYTFRLLDKEKTVIVSPSQWLKNQIQKSFFKDYNIKVISNGIKNDLSNNYNKISLREELKLPIDKKLILFVAADINDKNKGIKHILDIIDKFEDNVKFVSVGKPLESLNSKGLLQIGYVSDKTVLNKIYRACDIYVNPTLNETFSLTTAEALSNGLPVVAFNVGPIPELIGLENDCGILANEADSYDLKNCIDTLLRNENLRYSLQKKAVNKYINNYTFDKFANEYINLYEKLLDKDIF